LAVVGVALCFVPLFGALGYEWSLAMALAASFAGAAIGAARCTAWRAAGGGGARGVIVLRLYGGAVASLAIALVLPLAAVLLNGLRVPACDRLGGLGWLVALPLASGAIAAALGVAVGLARAWRGARTAALAAVAAVAFSLVWSLARLYFEPPVFIYDPFVGYVAGAIYDEDVAIPAALGWARLYHAALVVFALAACAALIDPEARVLRWRAARRRRAAIVIAVVAAAVAFGLRARRASLGFDRDADDLDRALGAEKRTPHFVLHYTPNGPYAAQIGAFAIDFEYRWAQHASLFPRAPSGPVDLYLFDSAEQGRALAGVAQTSITKGWRRMILLHYDGWPQPAIAHELGHVFAASFGDPIFGATFDARHIAVGLSEGVPSAVAWAEWQPVTPHQFAKVLREEERVDGATLATVMGGSFYALSGTRAYALAGSFCRFLIDTRGAAKLMDVYRAGAGDAAWRTAYGVAFDALADEWGRFVDAQSITPEERAFAAMHLRAPSVFARPCAHTAAVARRKAGEAAQAGDRAAALAAWEQACTSEEAQVEDLDAAIDAAAAAGDAAATRRLAAQLSARDDAGDALRAAAERAEGDVALADGATDDALRAYDRAARLPMSPWGERALALGRQVAARPAGEVRTTIARATVMFLHASGPSSAPRAVARPRGARP
jgi:hypothetical protein